MQSPIPPSSTPGSSLNLNPEIEEPLDRLTPDTEAGSLVPDNVPMLLATPDTGDDAAHTDRIVENETPATSTNQAISRNPATSSVRNAEGDGTNLVHNGASIISCDIQSVMSHAPSVLHTSAENAIFCDDSHTSSGQTLEVMKEVHNDDSPSSDYISPTPIPDSPESDETDPDVTLIDQLDNPWTGIPAHLTWLVDAEDFEDEEMTFTGDIHPDKDMDCHQSLRGAQIRARLRSRRDYHVRTIAKVLLRLADQVYLRENEEELDEGDSNIDMVRSELATTSTTLDMLQFLYCRVERYRKELFRNRRQLKATGF